MYPQAIFSNSELLKKTEEKICRLRLIYYKTFQINLIHSHKNLETDDL